jgi:hypothetical protein
MNEREWLTSLDPGPMLEPLRKRASDRKLYLLSIACLRLIYPYTPDDANAYAAFENAADCPDPNLGMSKAVERFPGYWGFDRGARYLAECTTRPREYSLWYKVPPIFREIFGNPFRPVAFDPSWLTSDVLALARGIYDERAFDRMPILADALQDAGCTNEDVLTHCRGANYLHVRGCWVVDLVLGKK